MSYMTVCEGGSDKAIRQIVMSALRELGCLARLMQTIFLTLFLARIAAEEPCLLEGGAVGFAVADAERAGDAVADGARLTGHAAAVDIDDDIELILGADCLEGLVDDEAHGVEGEVILEGALVDGDVALAGEQADALDGGLPSAGAEVLDLLLNGLLGSHVSPHLSSSAVGH